MPFPARATLPIPTCASRPIYFALIGLKCLQLFMQAARPGPRGPALPLVASPVLSGTCAYWRLPIKLFEAFGMHAAP